MQQPINPFKGARAYEAGEYFYGRNNEVKELYALVCNETLSLLFSMSGIGKTSLIQAGLIPYLKNESQFLPIYIHLLDALKIPNEEKAPEKKLVDFIMNKCKEKIASLDKAEELEITNPVIINKSSLFEYIHGLRIVKTVQLKSGSISKYSVKPLLIFDQFEEIFTLPFEKNQLDELFNEISYLTENKLPPYLKEAFENSDDANIEHIENALRSKQKEYRFMFAFREEYLPQFESLKRKIPSIKYTNSRFRLEPFPTVIGRNIIIETSQESKGISLETADIVSKELAAEMIGYDEPKIDPFVLSMICRHIYGELLENDSTHDVSKEKIQTLVKQGIERFLKQVYDSLPDSSREFIEMRLITPEGTKTSIDYKEIRDEKLKQSIDDLIKDASFRLLSKGQFLNSEYVSIQHDRLLPHLIERRRRREDAEKQKRLKEEELRLKEENRKKEEAREKERQNKEDRRRIVRNALVGLTLLIVVFLGFWLFFNTKIQSALILNRAAISTVETDPTLALRLSEKAIEKASGVPFFSDTIKSMFNTDAQNMYAENAFYKTILNGNNDTPAHAFISFSISKDSKKILTGSLDGSVTMWSFSGDSITSFNAPKQDSIIFVSFSPNDNYIITNSLDDTARLWNLKTREYNSIYEKKRSEGLKKINTIKFSPDEKSVLIGYSGGPVKIYNLDNLKRDTMEFQDDIISAVFTRDGKQIITGSKNDTVRVWSVGNMYAEPIKQFSGAGPNVKVAISPTDNGLIAAGCADGSVRLWNINDELFANKNPKIIIPLNPPKVLRFLAHNWGYAVNTIDFSPDGMHIFTGSDDKTAALYNLSGYSVYKFKGDSSRIVNVFFNENGNRFFTGSDDNTFREWKVEKSLDGEITTRGDTIAFASFNRDSIVTLFKNGEMRKWIVKDSHTTLIPQQTPTPYHNERQSNLFNFFSERNGKIITVKNNNTVVIKDINNRVIDSIPIAHGHKINYVAISNSGSKLVYTTDDSLHLYLLNAKKREPGLSIRSSFVSFNPNDDNEIFVGYAENGRTRLWREKDTIEYNFPKKIKNLYASTAAFSPNNKYLVIGYSDSARLFEKSGKYIGVFDTHGAPVKAVAFSTNGNYIATGSSDGMVRLWEINDKTGTVSKDPKVFKGHKGEIISLTFSADNSRILSFSTDQSVKLWNIHATLSQSATPWISDDIDKLKQEVSKKEEMLKP